MKLNTETYFPHPVLAAGTGDYTNARFAVALRIEETPASGKLKIGYTVNLDEHALYQQVQQGAAVAGLFVTCLDTFYSGMTVLEGDSGFIEFAPGMLRGRASVRPMICSVQNIVDFSSPNLHPDYGGQKLAFPNGSLLALDNEFIINVGRDKLAPMESIFTIAVNGDIPEGEIRVQTDSENITIQASTMTYQTINSLRGTKIGQSILLNSVYLPAVMEVLAQLGANESAFTEKKWYRVFNAKCEHLGISYATGNPLEDAQRLLKSPISKLKSVGDEL